jgi:hypothetical protein
MNKDHNWADMKENNPFGSIFCAQKMISFNLIAFKSWLPNTNPWE